MLPCPFCGCNKIETVFDYNNSYVMCVKCKATGPDADDNTLAEEAWDNQIYFNEKKTRQKEEYPIIWKNIK